jgi:hypothetical protein
LLPPNARRIKAARDAGHHPKRVHLVYTHRWCAGQYPAHAVMVMAREYTAREYSTWAWLAGLTAVLTNHDASWDDFAVFAADVAGYAAPVLIDGVDGGVVEIDYLMYAMRWPRPGQAWPTCWSDEQARRYAQRCDRWNYIQQRRERLSA